MISLYVTAHRSIGADHYDGAGFGAIEQPYPHDGTGVNLCLEMGLDGSVSPGIFNIRHPDHPMLAVLQKLLHENHNYLMSLMTMTPDGIRWNRIFNRLQTRAERHNTP